MSKAKEKEEAKKTFAFRFWESARAGRREKIFDQQWEKPLRRRIFSYVISFLLWQTLPKKKPTIASRSVWQSSSGTHVPFIKTLFASLLSTPLGLVYKTSSSRCGNYRGTFFSSCTFLIIFLFFTARKNKKCERNIIENTCYVIFAFQLCADLRQEA